MNTYFISIEELYPSEVKVKARSKKEAKLLAWEKFKRTIKKKNFQIGEFPSGDK